MAMKTRQYTQGFTLIELMITITLIGIMATIAMPSMSNFISNQRLANRVTQVTTIFRLARTEAVRRNNPVVICGGIKLKSDAKPNNGCDQGGNSLLAFIDRNNNNNYESSITNPNNDIDLRSVLINNESLMISSLDINLSNPSNNNNRFIFMPNGTFGVGKNSTPYIFSSNYLRVSASDGKRVRMTLIAPSGRVIPCNTSLTPDIFNNLSAHDYAAYCILP